MNRKEADGIANMEDMIIGYEVVDLNMEFEGK